MRNHFVQGPGISEKNLSEFGKNKIIISFQKTNKQNAQWHIKKNSIIWKYYKKKKKNRIEIKSRNPSMKNRKNFRNLLKHNWKTYLKLRTESRTYYYSLMTNTIVANYFRRFRTWKIASELWKILQRLREEIC